MARNNRKISQNKKNGAVLKRIEKSLYWLAEQYKKGQALKGKQKNSNIILGRSFSLGQQFQYIFAKHLFEGESKKYQTVLVDHPIRAGRKNLYPDLLVIRNNKVVAMIEIKLDLGWFREVKEETEKLVREYKLPRKISYVINNEEIFVNISKKMKKIFFIVTRANDHGRYGYVEKHLEGFDVVYCLNENHHPNRKDFKPAFIKSDILEHTDRIEQAFSWMR